MFTMANHASARVTHYNPQPIELIAQTDRPALLVLSEIYYRGWEAWLDDQRAPVERVNHALHGVMVPAGTHQVRFVFRFHSFRQGGYFSAAGLLLLLGGLVVNRLRRPAASAA